MTESAFLAACRGEAASHTPVWIMRQAGRYLPEYRKLRQGTDFLTFTKTPDLAAEVTLQPVRRFELDAAILFSDIMTPVEGMGVELEFEGGPVIRNPIRDVESAQRLRIPDPLESVPFVLETIRSVRTELEGSVPLIGFAGAPFTLLCYLVEGHGTRTFSTARAFMYAEPDAARLLMTKLADTMALYLKAQAEAGAQALMLFDSWVGLLAGSEFEELAAPAVARVFDQLRDLSVPLIYFPNQGGHLLQQVKRLGSDVVGIDWRTPLSEARLKLGPDVTLQGNLDPAALFAPRDRLAERIDGVLRDASGEAASDAGDAVHTPGRHIFNLGHGIDKATDPDSVAFLVDTVHERTAR
ncbi:MAG: uroporphyrinogen decarboxylase [Gemmatimonadota bacterium]